MIRILLICVSVIVSLGVSLIIIPIATLIYSFSLALLFSLIIPKLKHVRVFILQTITYTTSDFCGLILGAIVLRKSQNLFALPILYFIIVISGFLYAKKPYQFLTEQAKKYNFWQKIANLLGAAISILLIIVVTNKWR